MSGPIDSRRSRAPEGLHRLLRRQLRRHGADPDALPPNWRDLVASISDAYHQFDRDRIMVERSIALSSEELLQANARMREAVTGLRKAQAELESRVEERTRDLKAANETLQQAAIEQQRLEAQLRQAQKMEAIGLLAGGIAHDFNNLLTVIFGELDLLERMKNPNWQDAAHAIRGAAESAAALTQQLLAFSRRQTLTPADVDVNDLVRSTAQMLRRLIGEDVELATQLSPDAGSVHADRGQLQQVLLNLGVNARDAMPDGGRLTIATSQFVVGETLREGDFPIREGSYAAIAVTDTGVGIDAPTRARIFEPFFTTKAMNKGTGLGLATAYGIVKQSDGYIDVRSAPGHGSTFRVLLPQIASAAAAVPTPVEALRAAGSGTILVVEDQDPVRFVIVAHLRHAGYQVFEAASGAAAVDLAPTLPELDLLLTDVVMPQMSGIALAAKLRETRPHLRVIYMTGHTSQRLPDDDGGASLLLRKPFSAEVLLARVSDVLAPERTS